MKVYLTDSQVPELADLNRAQRRIVRRRALEMLRKDQPSIYDAARLLIGATAGIAGLVGIIVVRAFLAEQNWITRAVVAGLIVHVAVLISQSYLTEQLRPYFRLFVEQHRDEILSAA